MGVLEKRRRKIMRNDRLFYWWVMPDDDYCDLLHLSIMSHDKKFIIKYQLNQKNIIGLLAHKNPYIIVIGREFKGLADLGHFWERFLVPDWDDENITPSLVAQIIDWCFTSEQVTPVDFNGIILANRVS